MASRCRVIRKNELSTALWSGGTTTQLAIWPEDATYAGRDFIWRVSTARVETEESEFTPLPGISRILMVLEGELLLRHKGYREVTLGRFGQDSFTGDRKTTSRGRVTDFNLMISEGEGAVEVLEITPGGECRIAPPTAPDATAGRNGRDCRSEILYCLTDSVEFILPCRNDTPENRETYILNNGDAAVVHSLSGLTETISVKNTSGRTAHVIRATVLHN